MTKLTTIEGIGPAFEEKLQQAGVKSCEGLLEAGSTKKGREKIATDTGIDSGRVLRFVNHADPVVSRESAVNTQSFLRLLGWTPFQNSPIAMSKTLPRKW